MLKQLFEDPKVPVAYLVEILEKCDANKDGFISLKEVKKIVKEYASSIKDSSRYLKG